MGAARADVRHALRLHAWEGPAGMNMDASTSIRDVLRVESLAKRYGGRVVFEDVSFSIARGTLTSLVGPSGVGKTTLLHILAGLSHPDGGAVSHLSQDRGSAGAILVFQDYVLFPNMTVSQNIAFGLKARKLPKPAILEKVGGMVDFFGLGDRADAYPAELSGGQKQRVAIARAMVLEPEVLLLDEPFANLDRNLKMQTAMFIRETQRTFGITTVCVTHDLQEALAMSDRIGVMLGGRLRQFGPPQDVYSRPADIETARFLGPMNEITPSLAALLETRPGWMRPEAFRLERHPEGAGSIESANFAGHFTAYGVRILDRDILVYDADARLNPGDRVRVCLEPGSSPILFQ
jgi:putative spermidine/putrescine transport system ATP-binding protein